MSTSKALGPAIAAATILLGMGAFGLGAAAAPLSSATATNPTSGPVQHVGHRGWGGVGIYIGPGYGYYPSYEYGYYPRRSYYYDDYDYYPRRSYSYYDRYDRPYRKHSRRWVKERFEHPLGRR
jgi:hypothetical protein